MDLQFIKFLIRNGVKKFTKYFLRISMAHTRRIYLECVSVCKYIVDLYWNTRNRIGSSHPDMDWNKTMCYMDFVHMENTLHFRYISNWNMLIPLQIIFKKGESSEKIAMNKLEMYEIVEKNIFLPPWHGWLNISTSPTNAMITNLVNIL